MPLVATARRSTQVLVPLPQAPAGAQGPPGSYGLGQIRYADTSQGPEDSFSADTRRQLLFEPDPSQTQDYLNPPFRGHVFWSGNRIVGRAMGDYLDVLANLLVTTQVAGGKVRIDIDVGSPLGPTGTSTATLFNGAGVQERVTFNLKIQTLGYMLANGAALYLTSTVPLLVVSEAITVSPISAYMAPTP